MGRSIIILGICSLLSLQSHHAKAEDEIFKSAKIQELLKDNEGNIIAEYVWIYEQTEREHIPPELVPSYSTKLLFIHSHSTRLLFMDRVTGEKFVIRSSYSSKERILSMKISSMEHGDLIQYKSPVDDDTAKYVEMRICEKEVRIISNRSKSFERKARKLLRRCSSEIRNSLESLYIIGSNAPASILYSNCYLLGTILYPEKIQTEDITFGEVVTLEVVKEFNPYKIKPNEFESLFGDAYYK